MVNSLAFDYLAGAEALDELDLTGAGKKKKKKKKKKSKAPKAPIAGYDAATGEPVFDEIIGYDTRTGKPLYAQQEARRRQALAQAGGQTIVGYDEFGEPILGPAAAPVGYSMQPGFTPAQPALAAIGQGSMMGAFADVGEAPATPPPPPGWTPQAWAQYLYTQQTAQNLQQGPGGQGAAFFSLVEDSGGPQFGGAAPVDFESAGGAFYSGEEEQGGSFLDAGDFENLYGGQGDGREASPMFRAVGAVANTSARAGIGTPESRARAAALLGETEREPRGAAQTGARPVSTSLAPLFGAVSGSGCCECAGYKKYPRKDAIRDPF